MLKFEGVIDIHTHPFTEETVKGQGVSYTEAHTYFGRSPASPHHETWFKQRLPWPIEDSTKELTDDGCIDMAVIVNMNACTTWGYCLPNDYVGKYAQQYPDVYIGYGGIDPNMDAKGALRELDRCVKDLGLMGLKFHPAYQNFFPNDRVRAYPIYERCVEYGLPVLFHTGSTRMTRCTIRTCKPEYIDEVATDFPDLKIIMTHFGWPWTEEALAVIWRNDNVYLDLSGWMPRYVYATQPVVFQYLNTVVPEKFVFGSDFPAISPRAWLDDFAQLVESGYEWGGKRRSFKEDSIAKFLRLNAIEAMNLTKLAPERASRATFKMTQTE